MTKLVAIINATPDSFSDGSAGNYKTRINQAIEEGASVIDIGAESTRPGANLLTSQEEWARLEPVLSLIAPASPTDSAMSLTPLATKESGLLTAQTSSLSPKTLISIDTRHPETFRKAYEQFGAHWFNDVSGFTNPDSVALAADTGCTIVLMHSLSVPADPKQTLSEEHNVTQELLAWGKRRIEELTAAGIRQSNIVFDPGIGFGKTAEQNWKLLEDIAQFKALEVPIMVGHSRKSFLGGAVEERDEATAKITKNLAKQGIDYIRVHNIAANRLT